MINMLYIEEAVLDHPRVEALRARLGHRPQVVIKRWGEVFNRKAQSFSLQKQNPSLILAEKHDGFVLPAPEAYNIGSQHNYYFSHMQNCVYDCRYCFLQGMYRSAHYVLFVNYESFFEEIARLANVHQNQEVHFFSGYDCDSLALEPVTAFADYALDQFSGYANAVIELRTKSTQIRSLMHREPLSNCVIAMSLSPQVIVDALEAKTPSLQKRLGALSDLQQRGWKIGLRFDPVIYDVNFKVSYASLFEQVFRTLDSRALHSVSLGVFRMPKVFYDRITRLYPNEPLLAWRLSQSNGKVSYDPDIAEELMDYCRRQLLLYIDEYQLYLCDERL